MVGKNEILTFIYTNNNYSSKTDVRDGSFLFFIFQIHECSSWKSSLRLVYGLILCGIMPSDELVNTVVYICAPLIFSLFPHATTTGDRESGEAEVEQPYVCCCSCATEAPDCPLGTKTHNLYEWVGTLHHHSLVIDVETITLSTVSFPWEWKEDLDSVFTKQDLCICVDKTILTGSNL